MDGSSGGSDPFTGSGRYVPEGQDQSSAAANSHFPVKNYIFFDNISPSEQILGKLREFNKNVDQDQAVPEKSLDSLIPLIEGNTNAEGIKVLDKLISWPQEFVFPALDILRISIKQGEVSQLFCSRPGFIDLLVGHADPGSPAPCRMLVMRTFTNLFRYEDGVKLMLQHIDIVLQAAIGCRDLNTKNGQVAASTLLLNFCVKLSPVDDLDAKAKCLQASGELLAGSGKGLDPEASYRLLIGVGSLVHGDDGCKALAHSIDLPATIAVCQSSDTGKLAECARLLSQTLAS
ncbi:phospholipase A-2-activating protein [Elysia marginata]|uniref:Phospholipase A-2-activating protein n=1 Tax=Elysia marginata TaxID=1093978 RepID=A0AAV4GXD8_9GAST|nr:phospholipase A-2-activating protein [Elysia marginata]